MRPRDGGKPFLAQPNQVEADRSIARLDDVRGSNDRPAVRADDKRKLQGQTPSNFVDPVTGGQMDKTAIGDTFEKLFEAKAGDAIAKALGGDITALSGVGDATEGGRTARNTPLDFRVGDYGVELKSISSIAKNQKSAIKKDERERKEAEVGRLGLKPALIIQVVNQRDHTVKLYMFNAFVSKNARSGTLIGEYSFTDDDLVEAMKRAGAKHKTIAASAAWEDDPETIAPGDTVLQLDANGVPFIYTEPDVEHS